LAPNQNNVSEWIALSSTKRTSLSSHQDVTCSHEDIAENLLIWH